ncbi:MAG: (2Fe-2S)-binding protein [Methylocella sp.]
MIVCSCNVLTDAKIRDIVTGGMCPRTPGAVYKCLGCSPNCGRCIATLRMIISEALAETTSTGTSCLTNRELDDESLCPL